MDTTKTRPVETRPANAETIRHGTFGPIVWSPNGTRMATQDDLDTLPVGDDLTPEEEAEIED